jgi:hypothetical protein
MSYEMELISLRCNNAQERTDEPYLMVNGRVQWGPTSMRTGNTRTIGRRVPFDHDVTVELRESDSRRRVPDQKDDYIGAIRLDERTVRGFIRGDRGGPLTGRFSRDRGIVGDATYTLIYELHDV